jgi:hypothetical protein
MKPTQNFKMTKETKRLLASHPLDGTKNQYKKLMIVAQLTDELPPPKKEVKSYEG